MLTVGMQIKSWPALLISIVICNLAGALGSIFTARTVDTWYIELVKPSFNPPSWVFGPVWTTLYILMGISLYLVWIDRKKKFKKPALTVFGIQLALNALWSILFFGLQSPFYAFIEIIFLWAFILASIYYFYKISKPAAYLLIPYIAWVSFAAILNFFIYYLNI
jgi:tryptophan-rich sensory protein